FEHVEPTPSLKKLIPGFAPTFASSDYNVQVRAMAMGLGAMVYPQLCGKHQLYPGLVELPVELPLPPADLYLVCAKTMRWVPRVRAVAAELLQAIDEIEGLDLTKHELD